MHRSTHPLSKRTVILNINTLEDDRYLKAGMDFKVQDWFDRVNGGLTNEEALRSGDVLAKQYFNRTYHNLPDDEDLVVGYVGKYLYVVHETEMGGIWK